MAREVDRLSPIAGSTLPDAPEVLPSRPQACGAQPTHSPAARRRSTDRRVARGHASLGARSIGTVRARRPHDGPVVRGGALGGWLAMLVALLVAAGGAAPAGAVPAVAPGAPVAYRAPVPAPVRLLRPFVAPPQPWSPGHRGIDLALDEGAAVVAPAAGTVAVAGTVVDRGVVTIVHPDGLRSSVEPVRPGVVVGQQVTAGEPVGTLSGERSHCASPCLHWGVREGSRYLDPLALLPGGGPIVLLPDG